MKPITRLLETYKHKLYCDKFIKDYTRDLEELAKVNNSKVEKYTELVKQTLLEVPALKKIASNDTKEGRGNCTYVIQPKNDTLDPSYSSHSSSSGSDDTNSTDNATADGTPDSNSTVTTTNTTAPSTSNTSSSANASLAAKTVSHAVKSNTTAIS